MKRGCLFFLFILFSMYFTSVVFSQEEKKNFNRYYRFPLSLGVEYQMLTPFSEYGKNFNVFEISGNVRWPIPPLPLLQVAAEGGIMQFDSLDEVEPKRWDHLHVFGGAGMVVAHRFTKEFEVGADVMGGVSEAIFSNLDPTGTVVGNPNWFVQAGAKICLNPSYNFNIEVHPNVKYLGSLAVLKQFEGFIFSIGFGAHFRFGRDPDSPQAVIRSLRFDTIEVPSLFSALQSYYTKNPIGTLVFTNKEKQPVRDVNISFFQPGYMDSPTPAETIEELAGGESKEIELFATFNDEVFRIEGVTPLTGEVIVTYTSQGRAAEQRQSVTYDLHDKTALTWDDDRKVASFITPADSALRNYTSFIRQTCKEEIVPGFSKELQEGMQIFEALNVLGCLYQVDPRNPFTEVQDNPMVVDSISLPRDTLKRITGDCDDLTVLYCSLLETVGIESGFITVPGHIYAGFNTGVPVREFATVHPEREMTINIDGELWVPVEITMVGKHSFLEAWRKGIEAYRQFEDEPQRRGVYITREAQQTYRPVGLKETDLGLQYGEKEQIVVNFKQNVGKLVDYVVADYQEAVEKRPGARSYNKLGIAYAQFKQYAKAEEAFRQALSYNTNYLSASVNMGNVAYLRGAFKKAIEGFSIAFDSLKRKNRGRTQVAAKVLLNMSKAYYAIEDFDQAESYYKQAETIDKGLVEQHSYLASVSEGGSGRAAEAVETTVLFLDEEEEVK